ncbi:hypothetical protein ADK52_24805 [Streptomyces sp. WM6372]|uniref:DUF4132 domain-containing protein n=1 Tax=Streptomyces sp. WM6372 TaxID=1415555 RepID=UPI0006AD99E7|nr:DUF4132 domain-containing protein [Streptomyces sp. WM6372]KOU21155.1 hypothetical protein ADK52_24805 [Streptomyces sp. WM6372]
MANRTYSDAAYRALEDENASELATALLKAAIHYSGHWRTNKDAAALLTAVNARPAEFRQRLVDALADALAPLADDSPAPANALGITAAVGRGLTWGEPLDAVRREKLDEIGRKGAVHYCGWVPELVLAELDAGRTVPPAVVATLRRSALVAYGYQPVVALAPRLTEPVLNVGEAWADRAMADGERWHALLAHAATATAAKPTGKWEKTGRALIEEAAVGSAAGSAAGSGEGAGEDAVRERLLGWFRLVGAPRTLALQGEQYGPNPNDEFDAYNANALRGLAWLLSFLPPHPDTARTLGALAETSLRNVAGLGPRCPKVANAAVTALSRIDGEASLAELARLATRVTFKGTLKMLDSALEARAVALGLSREEIEELAVPAYGLTSVGRAAYELGGTTALVEVRGAKAVLSWRSSAGKAVKSVPAAVRRDHAEELKELKAAVKDIDKMLGAQAERLDRQFLARRTWSYGKWRERYVDHPLVGTLARRLLWVVDGTPVGFADGELRTLADTPVAEATEVTEGAEVTLWHPIDREPAEAAAWRDWLERHGITQPFKQAHREVYPLTDAELRTGTYSNRFAAHYLRQHQFHSLAALRGWRNKLRLAVDDSAPPAVRELPQWGLRAEYWIEGDGGDHDDLDITDSGSFLRLRTDQVRFYPIGAPENLAHACGGEYTMWLRDGEAPVDPVPLAEVPALVLSEVLRDVDLFVGVASVGNDPTWQDGGPGGRFHDYWTSYGFGELSQSAETRRLLLERLVPRLAIADRCRIEGRFLHVRGELRGYRIHLGSGNILMDPGDQYLCIVPAGRTASGPETGYLPFEGDRTLALILSKAMMLADDTGITDPSITRQILSERA